MKCKSNHQFAKNDKKISERATSLIFVICMCVMICGILTSCSVKDFGEEKDEEKMEDVSFEVIADEYVPTELKKIIEDRKDKMFKTTFEDGGDLYIVVGYGEQPTGGYSIRVNELYETRNALYIKTEFIGPSKNESVTQNVSYPYIVVKTANTDKTVVFK